MKTITEYLQSGHIITKYKVNPKTDTDYPQEFDAYKISWYFNNQRKSAYGVIAKNEYYIQDFSTCYFVVTALQHEVRLNGNLGIHESSNKVEKLNDKEIQMLNEILNYYLENCTDITDDKYFIGYVENYKFIPEK